MGNLMSNATKDTEITKPEDGDEPDDWYALADLWAKQSLTY